MADDILTPEEEAEWRTFEEVKRVGVAYKIAANQPAIQAMLQDLAMLCRANRTTIVRDKNGRIDETATHILEGRREVWLHIQAHLNLNSKQLFALYTGRPFSIGETNDGSSSDDTASSPGDDRYTMVSGEG